MKVTLVYGTPLALVSDSIRMCYASQRYSDNGGVKDRALIDKVANKFKHKSVMRHSFLHYEITCSTKTLLAMTRHKAGIDFSVESTRFTLKKRKDELQYTPTQNDAVNADLDIIMDMVTKHLNNGVPNDTVAMLCPQAYEYTFRVSLNFQAMQHLCNMRISKEAHYDIRATVDAMYHCLPEEIKHLIMPQEQKNEK